jgi:hypothetical protein
MAGAKVTSRHPIIGLTKKTKPTDESKLMKLNSHIHKTIGALCILVLSPALVFAADTTQPSREHGVIKSVDMDAHTLVVAERKDNSEHTFQWNDQTKFSERDKTVTASDLKVGERVYLSYAPGENPPILQSLGIAHCRSGRNCANKGCTAKSPDA